MSELIPDSGCIVKIKIKVEFTFSTDSKAPGRTC